MAQALNPIDAPDDQETPETAVRPISKELLDILMAIFPSAHLTNDPAVMVAIIKNDIEAVLKGEHDCPEAKALTDCDIQVARQLGLNPLDMIDIRMAPSEGMLGSESDISVCKQLGLNPAEFWSK